MSESRTALITGASAGIGTAFAEEYAKRGYDLILTARRLDRLQALADRLAGEHGVTCACFAADLSRPEAPEALHREVVDAGLRVDVLVNNAGYGIVGAFREFPWDTHRAFIQTMCTSVAHLTHLFLPGMVERGYGRIIHVSSVAGLLPGTPGSGLYAAVKSFCIFFAESLAPEVEKHGVNITAVCPGFTRTEFHDVADMHAEVSAFPDFLWLSANTVARQGIEAVDRGKPVYVNGIWYRILATTVRLLPYPVSRWLALRGLSFTD